MVEQVLADTARETLINVILSEATDQIACDDGCKSLKSLHVT